jgi:hypothetical protein
LSSKSDLVGIDITEGIAQQLQAVRWFLPIGWGLAAIGFLGPWIAHQTAALTLSGADMAEFVKFLPGAIDGSLRLVRQCFYLPPFAVVVSIALLIGSRRLHYTGLLQAIGLFLAIPISLQLLPAAWSPSSLMAREFRIQTLALGVSWLLLASFWLLKHLPLWLLGSLSTALSLAALALSIWQFLLAKPEIDQVYGAPPNAGWGLFLCLTGMAIVITASGFLALAARSRTRARRTG